MNVSMAHWVGMPITYTPLLLVGLWALATPVQLWAARDFYAGAWKALKNRTSDMNTLVVLGTSAAYLYSLGSTFAPALYERLGWPRDVYYETAAVIITLVLLGRLLETDARRRASDAIRKLLALRPNRARLVLPHGVEKEIPVDRLSVGNYFRVRPGDRIAADGVVLEGESAVDESLLTGESMPVDKAPGAWVTGGTINAHGTLLVRASRVGADSALARIVRLVEEAQSSRAPIQRIADRVVAVFVPVVLVVALIAGVVWLFADPSRALLHVVTTLIIACPCAMGLATPVALIVGIGRGAESGVLVRSAEALEKLSRVDTVVFDKTGTLTAGKPELVELAGAERALALAAAAETHSEHPLASAIVRRAMQEGMLLPVPEEFRSSPGLGVRATIDGQEVRVGSLRWLETPLAELEDAAEAMTARGRSVVGVAENGTLIGVLGLADSLKPAVRGVVERLRREGQRLVLVTGDARAAATEVARELGIAEVHAEVLPEGKIERVRSLRAEGRRVAMVGDGVNDAPALAEAYVGIAVGTGSDVALETADVTLLRGDLRGVARALVLARVTMRVVRQNLFWAFAYNVLGIPIAAGVLVPFFGIALSPMLAAVAMSLSSLSVVTNSLRLKKARLP
jgi:Cu+-exporting ATPase